MGLFHRLFGKRSSPQPAARPKPKVLGGLEDGSPFVIIDNGNGAVMMMDRMAYDYMYGESKKPNPSQRALDGLLAKVVRVKVWAGGMMRDKPTSEVLLAEVTEPALLKSFRRAFRISDDPSTFNHCMCLGQPTMELFDQAGERAGTLGMQHSHAVRWDFWKHDAQLLDGKVIADWLAERGVASEHLR